MSLPFQNVYHHRRVAESASKPCIICYRPASSVLITPDQADFFYTCAGHLKDTGFASPVGETPAAEEERRRRKREALEREVREEVERKKRELEARAKGGKDGEKDKDKDKEGKDKKEEGKEEEKEEEKKEKKDAEEEKEKKPEPRVFTLHKKIFDMRLTRYRQQQMARRNQERLKDPNLFPSVPKGNPV